MHPSGLTIEEELDGTVGAGKGGEQAAGRHAPLEREIGRACQHFGEPCRDLHADAPRLEREIH
jgi:hypothetical protein